MTNHTPGPWVVHVRTLRHIDARYILAGQSQVATVAQGNEANAHLIAAAPDMLAALEMALASGLIKDRDPVGDPGTLCPVHDSIIAAIAKARGS